MENRQDYLLLQINTISKFLRRLLEKVLDIKMDGDDEDELHAIMQTDISADKEALMIATLGSIDGSELVTTLVDEHGYTPENIKLLADVLYELSSRVVANAIFRRKALILYRHYLAGNKISVDFSAFNRVTELEKDETAANG